MAVPIIPAPIIVTVATLHLQYRRMDNYPARWVNGGYFCGIADPAEIPPIDPWSGHQDYIISIIGEPFRRRQEETRGDP
jgi:hypothetical protein